MQRELYLDISSENSGGSLYRITAPDGSNHFQYSHSTYDEENDETKVFETAYPNFASFWADLIKDTQWFYRHPLFVHPEQRKFIETQLASVDWNIHPDPKWQTSHRRQWTKVLTDPGNYYRGPA